MNKIVTARCPTCSKIHSVRVKDIPVSVRSDNGIIGVECCKCNTARGIKESAVMPRKATRDKIVCYKCGDVYYGSHKLFSIETDMQGWVDKGYTKELCVPCKSRQSYLEAEKRLEARLLITEPHMVMSQYKIKSSGRKDGDEGCPI